MPGSKEPTPEHPSTYLVQDRSNLDELQRVLLQDQMITVGMGGVLPEQPDPSSLQRVLDVGCGTGRWIIEAAVTYPSIELLAGVDVSQRMIEYARVQAEERQVASRVEFRAMDALRMLEFPARYFDLVNLRFGTSFLRVWDWPKLLQEFQRVARPGGIVRVTESGRIDSSSPALMQLSQILLEALNKAGHVATTDRNGGADELVLRLVQHGLQHVQSQDYLLEFRANTPQGEFFIEDMLRGYRTGLPFIRKWTRVPDDYEELYQQALSEMHRPDFVATWHLLTAWGTVVAKRRAVTPVTQER